MRDPAVFTKMKFTSQHGITYKVSSNFSPDAEADGTGFIFASSSGFAALLALGSPEAVLTLALLFLAFVTV